MEKRTVLFVDDEEKILVSLKRCLMGEPYETLFAGSGKEALEILQQNYVKVIVTDMCMPEMGGLKILRAVKEEYPHIVRIVLSGYTETLISGGEVSAPILRTYAAPASMPFWLSSFQAPAMA